MGACYTKTVIRKQNAWCEHHIHKPGLGAIYACADDIGAAITGLRCLSVLHCLFERCRRASGLTLKPSKCIAILVSIVPSEVNIRAIRDWLSNHIPDWKNFKFSPMGKYLGIHIGPITGGLNWKAPMDKAMARVVEIHLKKPPLPPRRVYIYI